MGVLSSVFEEVTEDMDWWRWGGVDGDNFAWFAAIIVETNIFASYYNTSTTTTGTELMYNN